MAKPCLVLSMLYLHGRQANMSLHSFAIHPAMQATLNSEALLLFGAGGHASVILETLLAYEPSLLQRCWVDGSSFPEMETPPDTCVLAGHTLPVFKQDLATFHEQFPTGRGVIVFHNRRLAMQYLHHNCQSMGVPFATVIHPTAWVSPTACLGEGVQLLPYSVVHTEAQLGRFVIVNTHAVVEHQAIIGDYASVAPGALVLGQCTVGEKSFIGAGAVIRQTLSVGAGCMVGAGAVVVNDIPDYTTVTGVPAKP